jgi:hypothetical protein
VVNGSGASYVSISNSNGQIISSSTAGTFNTVAALNYDLTNIAAISTNITGTKTNGSNILTACSGTNFTAAKIRPGMGITAGSGIPAGTYITAVNIAGGTIMLSANATNNGSGVSLTVSSGLVSITTGSSPNRIFTVQWSGRKRYNVTADDMDFQIKLYETTNVIEVYYNTISLGTASVAGTDDLGQIGLKGAGNTDFNNRATSSNWAATAAGGSNTASCTLSAGIKPVAGQMYQCTPPPCMTSLPSGLTPSSVLTTTATISWTAASPAPANGYEYYISTASTAPISSTTATGNPGAGILSASLTSLNPGTLYYFWVRGNCGSGKSAWIGSGSFTTPCVNATLTYTQGFNTVSIPTCWSQQFVTGSTAIQYVASSTNPTTAPQEGADYVYWNSFAGVTSGNQTRLVSAPITTTGSPSVNAKFYWFHDNSAYTTAGYADEGIKLQYSLNGTTWFDVQTINRLLTGINGWTLYDIALPAGAGNVATMYVGFLFTSRGGDNCALDNLTVYVPLPCTTPTDQPAALSLTAVTATSLSGSFTAASPSPTGYIVMRSTVNATPALTNGTTYTVGSSYLISGNNYTVVSYGTATSFTESSLTPGTQYYYYIFSYNGSCAGAPYILNTLPLSASALTCTAATASLTGTAVSTTSASINFSAVSGAANYILQYSVAGANAWIIASPAPVTSPYTLNGLASGTTYDIRLEGPNSSCGTTRTTTSAFTTPCSTASLTYTQGFNASTIPACWSVANIAVQTASKISFVTTGSSPSIAPYEGSNCVQYNSFSSSNGGAGSEERLVCTTLNTTGVPSVDVDFFWVNENSTSYNSGAYLNEGVQLQYSINGGVNWINTGSFIPRYDGTLASGIAQWKRKTITLPGACGNIASLLIGFKFHSEYGDNCFLDKVTVKATPPCNYAGTASIAAASVCASSGSTTLSATDYSVAGAGLAYQWQYSNDNFVSNIVDLPSGTNPASANTGTVSVKTYYRLRVFCTSAGYSYSNIVSFSVGSYAISTTTPATRCGIGAVTLQATATAGSSISWYTAATGGTSIGSGGNFVTPEISTTTNYYVGANDGSTSATIGPTYSGSNTNDDFVGSHGIIINTTSPNIVILSARIPFTGKGTFTIQLQTTAGTVVSTVVTDEYTGGGSVPVTIPLNMAVTTPGTYRLLITAVTGTIFDLGYISSPAFPYTGLGGAFSVTSGYWYNNTSTSSLYLFNLVVTNLCESARTLVAATVTPAPALTISANAATICSGSSTAINVTTPGTNFSTYAWLPATGVTASGSPSGMTVALNPTATTNYTLTATSASGCVNKTTALITVNAAPPVTVGAAVCSGTIAVNLVHN